MLHGRLQPSNSLLAGKRFMLTLCHSAMHGGKQLMLGTHLMPRRKVHHVGTFQLMLVHLAASQTHKSPSYLPVLHPLQPACIIWTRYMTRSICKVTVSSVTVVGSTVHCNPLHLRLSPSYANLHAFSSMLSEPQCPK